MLISLLILSVILTFALFSLRDLRENLYEEKRLQTREMVNTALGVLRRYHTREQQGEISRGQAQQLALQVIENMTYGPDNQNYFWIQDKEPILLMHPNAPELTGEYIGDLEVVEGQFLIREIMEVIDQHEAGFVEYYWQYFEEEDNIQQKLSYVSEFPAWDWVIGTGVYTVDIDTAYVRQRNRFIFIGFLSLIFSLILTYFIASYFSRPLIRASAALQKLVGENSVFQVTPGLKKYRKRNDEIGNLINSLFVLNKDLKRMTASLKRQISWKDALFTSSNSEIIQIDDQEQITNINKKFQETFGFQLENIKGQKIELFLKNRFEDTNAHKIMDLLSNSKSDPEIEINLSDQNKNRKTFLINTVAVDIWGEIKGNYIIFNDVTALKETERKLQITYFSIDKANLSIFRISPDGNFEYVNEIACRELGYSEQELLNMKVSDIDYEAQSEERRKYWQLLKEEKEISQERIHRTKKGTLFPVQLSRKYLEYQGQEYELAFAVDITERKQREEKIRYISYHDSVTGLYNRNYMEEKIKELDTDKNLPVGIIMADINGLKMINDAYGHERGDEILLKTADLLRNCLHRRDILARWAGDEFIILMPQTGKEEAQKIIDQITDSTKNTKDQKVPLSLGLGFAVKDNNHQDIYDVVHKAEDRVNTDKLTKSKSTKNKMVQNILNTLGAKSHETKEHARRMIALSRKLGVEIDLDNQQLNYLSLLAILHDIGKINIAEEILKKPDKLTEQEWETIKEHTEKGYSIAKATEEFAPVAESILAHHERWDGEGYPQGLKGEEIPLLARIISIIDAYDVMTNGRPYKEPVSKEEAIKELQRCAGSQFDPRLVEVFIELLRE